MKIKDKLNLGLELNKKRMRVLDRPHDWSKTS